jgi:hypothetical protein
MVLILMALLFPISVTAQENDSSRLTNPEFITDQLENISSSTDLSIDYSDLVEDYLYYKENPISINDENAHKLVELFLINEFQFNNIRRYINNYGSIRSQAELSAVEGFDRGIIEKISPFISFSVKEKRNNYSLKDIFKYGRHQFISRYSQTLEKSLAYMIPNDSAEYYPGKKYLGSPQKYYARYSFDFNKKIKYGFTLEKDAGEPIGKTMLNDSIRLMVGDKISLISDFMSVYVYVSDIKIIKKIIIGDYHLEFGQGLTLWSGLTFGKSADATMIKKYARGIVPNTSVNENRFMRGGAICLGFKKLEISGFYSKNNIDANIIGTNPDGSKSVSGLLETGNHRTINELLDRKVLNIQSYGGNINFKSKIFSLGLTGIHNIFDLSFGSSQEVYKKFYFQGNQFTNLGIHFTYIYKYARIFGEIAASSKESLSALIGSNFFIGNRVVLSSLYRNYSKDYYNFLNNSFREGSSSRNEKGIYFGIKLLPFPGVSIDAYADFFSFPWIKYGVSYPSKGAEYLVQINYSPLKDFNVYFRFKTEFKSKNFRGDYVYIPQTGDYARRSFRLHSNYLLFNSISFKNRIEIMIYETNKSKEYGYLFYQDINFHPGKIPLSINVRYAIFSTDGWDSRIYAYENDVLYAFSVPAYYDKGQRYYFNIKYRLSRHLDIWFRIAGTVFRDKAYIGSGADLIQGNHKTEVKVQAKIKL